MGALLIAVALAADLSAVLTAARIELPERVTIEVSQGGWGYQVQRLTIVPDATGYTDGTRHLDATLLRALVAAAQAPVVPALDPGRLGLTRRGLRAAAAKFHSTPEAAQLAEMISKADLRVFGARAYGDLRSDDWPFATIDITLRGGRKVSLRSGSYDPFMIPWRILEHDHGVDSWDPAIGRAVGALLPRGFLNRDRIDGTNLADEIVEYAKTEFWIERTRRR